MRTQNAEPKSYPAQSDFLLIEGIPSTLDSRLSLPLSDL